MKHQLIYMTTKNIKEARKIANYLIKNRLAACCNIIPKIESIYYWKNKLVKEGESVLIAKTTNSKVKKLITEVKKIHSYKVPCIISLEIKEGNKDFLNWIKKEIY